MPRSPSYDNQVAFSKEISDILNELFAKSESELNRSDVARLFDAIKQHNSTYNGFVVVELQKLIQKVAKSCIQHSAVLGSLFVNEIYDEHLIRTNTLTRLYSSSELNIQLAQPLFSSSNANELTRIIVEKDLSALAELSLDSLPHKFDLNELVAIATRNSNIDFVRVGLRFHEVLSAESFAKLEEAVVKRGRPTDAASWAVELPSQDYSKLQAIVASSGDAELIWDFAYTCPGANVVECAFAIADCTNNDEADYLIKLLLKEFPEAFTLSQRVDLATGIKL